MVLVVSATPLEAQWLGEPPSPGQPNPIPMRHGAGPAFHLLITGVGASPTSHHLAWHLAKGSYSHVVSIGIAGSYDPAIGVGEVVVVSDDRFADYGIDNRGTLEPLDRVERLDSRAHPTAFRWPHAHRFPLAAALPRVRAITVATASGSRERIALWQELFAPQIETMEGAAVFYSCLRIGVPFICLRAISNPVTPRDPSQWDIGRAIQSLARAAGNLLRQPLV